MGRATLLFQLPTQRRGADEDLPKPKGQGPDNPCQMLLVMAFPMEAKTKKANQTKGSSSTQKLWAQVTRMGCSQTSPQTIMQWLEQFLPKSSRDRNASKSSKELVSAPKLCKP